MDNQEYQSHFTGELADDYCEWCGYRKCVCFEHLLIEADVLTKAEGWRMLLHAHDHVWRDRQWPWRVRFDVTGMLWSKALSLCKETMMRRVA